MILFARGVVKSSRLTAMTTGCIVHVSAMRRQGGKMENYPNILMYKIAMSMAEEMLKKGIISSDEYTNIEAKMCEKFSINSCSIYRNMT